MTRISNILGLLPALGKEDRALLRSRLSALDSLDKDGPSPNDPKSDDEVLGAICSYMRQKGLEHTPIPALTRSPQYSAFAKKCPQVLAYLGTLSKLERGTLLLLGVGLLYDNLCQMGVPITTRTLMSHIHRLPACLNRAFPLYAQNGMLQFIVRKKVQNGPKKV